MRNIILLIILSFIFIFIISCCELSVQCEEEQIKSQLMEYVVENHQTPEEYILSKFNDHDIVILGEFQRIKHDPVLIQNLIPKLPDAGVYFLAFEYARRIDQPLIDKLLNASEYDEELARKILFNHWVSWGFQEYLDIFKVAWQLNQDIKDTGRQFRILALNNAYDWSHIKNIEDHENPEIMDKVNIDLQSEDYWAKVIIENVTDKDEKALVYCSYNRAFTQERQPKVYNSKFDGFFEKRLGNYLYNEIGDKVFTIKLHAPWLSDEGYHRLVVYAADGYIDAILDKLDPQYQNFGVDLKGTPFGELPGETSIYKHAYENFKLNIILDGWVCQGPLTEYEGVTPIKDFINEDNLEEARLQSPIPYDRDATAAKLNHSIAEFTNGTYSFHHLISDEGIPPFPCSSNSCQR